MMPPWQRPGGPLYRLPRRKWQTKRFPSWVNFSRMPAGLSGPQAKQEFFLCPALWPRAETLDMWHAL